MHTSMCAVPPREQVCVVSAVVWSGRRECSRSGVCFLPTYWPSFPSAVLGKISSNLTSVHAGDLPQRMWDDGADGHPL